MTGFVASTSTRAAATKPIARLLLPILIIALSIGLGLLASYPLYLLVTLGGTAIIAVGFLDERIFLGFIIVSSGVSLAFLTGGERTLFSSIGGANIDGLRLALILGGFLSLALLRPSVLAPIRLVGIYGAYLAYAAVTILWSPSLFDGIRMYSKLLYPVIVFLLSASVARKHDDHVLPRLVVVGVLVATILNVTVAASGASLFSTGFTSRFHGASHPNSIGLFSVFAGLTVYAFWLRRGGKLYVVLMLMLIAQIIASGSRTALVTGGVGFVVLEWLSGRPRRAILVGSLCVGIWFLVPMFGERTLQSGADAGLAPIQVGSLVNVSGRMVLWADAWSALMGDHQLFGRGLGATDHFFLSRYSDIASIHNGYLLLLIDSGVLGLVLVLGFFMVVVSRLIARRSVLNSAQSDVCVLAIALTAMLLLASMTESTFGGFEFPTVITWAMYGVAWGRSGPEGRRLQDGRPRGTTAWSSGVL